MINQLNEIAEEIRQKLRQERQQEREELRQERKQEREELRNEYREEFRTVMKEVLQEFKITEAANPAAGPAAPASSTGTTETKKGDEIGTSTPHNEAAANLPKVPDNDDDNNDGDDNDGKLIAQYGSSNLTVILILNGRLFDPRPASVVVIGQYQDPAYESEISKYEDEESCLGGYSVDRPEEFGDDSDDSVIVTTKIDYLSQVPPREGLLNQVSTDSNTCNGKGDNRPLTRSKKKQYEGSNTPKETIKSTTNIVTPNKKTINDLKKVALSASTTESSIAEDTTLPQSPATRLSLVYPFKADKNEMEAAASDLTELSWRNELTTQSNGNESASVFLGGLKPKISDEECNLLQNNGWLNDSLIDMWMQWISRHITCKQSVFPHLLDAILSTFEE